MFRSIPYLAFIIDHPCCAPGCLLPADHAHHFARRHGGGGVALKPHDTFTVPLCDPHHNGAQHQHGALPGITADETEALFMRTALKLTTEWMMRHQ